MSEIAVILGMILKVCYCHDLFCKENLIPHSSCVVYSRIWPACISFALSCHEYVEDSLFFWVGIEGMLPPLRGATGGTTPCNS